MILDPARAWQTAMEADAASLLPGHAHGARIAWHRGRTIDREEFLSHVHQVMRALAPWPDYVINLCEDRYLFMVAFAAGVAQCRTILLPPSRAIGQIADIASGYPRSRRLTDSDVGGVLSNAAGSADLEVPVEHVAAIVFTSGSTGVARPHQKRWGDLVLHARLAARRLAIDASDRVTIVATVPAQHMYGLETTVLLPLIAGATVHSGRPFFPEDIRCALAEVPEPRILVSTPMHLQVCLAAALEWPAIECVISATAPLSKLLAAHVEQALRTRVVEIYGCTEAGSIASRRTVEGDLWHAYEGLTLREVDGAVQVSGAPLPDAVPLTDVLRLHGTATFHLLGRHSDMVNIAGKRASLAELNIRLTEIDGVVDGIFIAPESSADSVARLVALVVAPDLSENEILAALAPRIDPIFLPRPLHKVEALPRTDSGKLPKEALAEFLAQIEAPRRTHRQ